MTEILKDRWKKLAGIVSESSYHHAKHDHLVKAIDKHVVALLKDLDLDNQSAVIVYDDLKDMLKRYLSSVVSESVDKKLDERTSPEAAQDLGAYLGSNDSVDGPYTELSDLQPMDYNPKKDKKS